MLDDDLMNAQLDDLQQIVVASVQVPVIAPGQDDQEDFSVLTNGGGHGSATMLSDGDKRLGSGRTVWRQIPVNIDGTPSFLLVKMDDGGTEDVAGTVTLFSEDCASLTDLHGDPLLTSI
jgi:hypothetical protein